MWSTAREVAAGDTVIIWLTRDQVQPLVVTPGKDFNTKFGNFRQADFVGVPYGSKVPSRSGRGFIHILRPTPELWTIALPHRTQILYLADIAFITSHLNIRHGSKVIEAEILTYGLRHEGTGSASFSHSVARNIGSLGHLYSYEFHEARFIKAKEEFTRHGMDDIVTIQHRNVCKEGFTVVDEVDSVFLDLPAPWEAIEHAKKALRKDCVTRICCFSPCMEQVLRTVSALNEAGFTEITMYETLLRPIEVFQTPQLQSITTVSEKLKISEVKREEKRLRQIAANKAAAAAAAGKVTAHAKRKRTEDGDEEADNTTVDETGVENDSGVVNPDITASTSSSVSGSGSGKTSSFAESSSQNKKIKTDDPAISTNSISEGLNQTAVFEEEKYQMDVDDESSVAPKHGAMDEDEEAVDNIKNDGQTPIPLQLRTSRLNSSTGDGTPVPKINVSKVLPEVRGHTSYLTFACLIPNFKSNSTTTTTPAATSVADSEAVDTADPVPEKVDPSA